MPELPEVETVVRDLRPLLTGRTIAAVRQSKRKLRRPWLPAWNAAATGLRIEGLRRRGKWILIDVARKPTPPGPPSLKGRGEKDIDNSETSEGEQEASRAVTPLPFREGGPGGVGQPALRVHLGMSGQFTVAPAGAPEPDHLHVVFSLDDGHELRLRDPRRFGSAEFFPDRHALDTAMNEDLGPEPFGIDAEYFRTAVRGTKRTLKAILLDQTIVAGVGNIYADEACFRAKLNPGRTGAGLSADECDRLRAAIEAVMTKAIDSRGSTIRDYIGGSGLRGGFQNEFAVYGRTGEPCPACETAIAVGRHAGRASHYCPVCQKDSPQRPQRPQRRAAKK
jgi:formamidopyrimidine-DNA glycosylase